MQKIYRKPMPKCNFNKAATLSTEMRIWHGCSSVNFLHIFNTIFPKNTPTSSRLFLKRPSEISFFKIDLSLGEQPQNEI